MEYEHEITVFFHFIGMGLLVTMIVAGFLLERKYRSLPTLQEKGLLLSVMKQIGLLSPLAILLLLVTGIGNMHSLAIGIFTFGWLTAKIIFFAIAATNGIMFSVVARKRGTLVGKMLKNEAPPNAELQLKNYNKQVTMFHIVIDLLFIIILALAVYGRHGGGQS
ncbi:MAG: hypothetical protein ACHQQQ_02015 [Bacteroidota bacterium]